MNVLRFTTYESNYGDETVRFVVDGTDLRALVYQAEREMGEVSPNDYDGPQASVVAPPSNHLYGEAASDWISSGSIPGTVLLLGCTCGTEGCWPLHVRIEVSDDVVRWTGFANPYRKQWTYEALGTFEFGRSEYDAAIRVLETPASVFLSGPRRP